MNIPELRVGQRVVASFFLVLIVMSMMTAIALWRLHAVHGMMRYLVDEKLMKQQLAAELLDTVNLNGTRAVAIAKSDSLEVQQYFEKELTEGVKQGNELVGKLRELSADAQERSLMEQLSRQRTAYSGMVEQIRQMKNAGRTVEVEQLLESQLAPSFQEYVNSLRAMLAYQKAQAQAIASASQQAYENSLIVLSGLGALSIAIGALLAWLLTRSIVAPLKEAVAHAEAVAQGDLSSRPVTKRNDETGQLMHALKRMSDNLAETVGAVRSATRAVAGASKEIAAGNLDLSARTEQQAGSLQETTSSMEEVTAAVKQTADNAQQASLLTAAASEIAGAGRAMVSQVVDRMASINESSQRIADITGLIDGIAFQTNILALNAAVEAARAGEHGRGFAVVAAEVRTLSQRCAAASKEIKSLIEDSSEKVDAGNRLAAQAGAAMEEIVGSVARINGIVGEISMASREQASGIEQINEAVVQMDQVTQQNAALVEEAAAASASMQEQAASLARAVAVFRLGEKDEQEEQRQNSLVFEGADAQRPAMRIAAGGKGRRSSRPFRISGEAGSASWAEAIEIGSRELHA